jgi:hypothetical protein
MTIYLASTQWRAGDLEGIRAALGIPVSAASIGAIGRAMTELERDYPAGVAVAVGSLERIAAIDQQLASTPVVAEPVVIKTSRKGAAGPVPTELPKRKLDVIEFATELLLEEVATEYALPASQGPGLAAQRRQQVERLLLVLPGLRVWQPQSPPRFQGVMERS